MKLTKRLDSKKPMSSNTSFSFLDDSTASVSSVSRNAKCNTLHEQSDSSTSQESTTSSLSLTSSDEEGTLKRRVDLKTRKPQVHHEFQNATAVSYDPSISHLLRENNRFQRNIVRELRRLRQSIRRMSPATQPSDANNEPPLQPVLFHGVDLTTSGKRNMDHCQCAIYLARKLFTDSEMRGKSIFPKRVDSKPPLSPHRSQVLADAIKSRFHYDDESPELQEAFNSVNQLTSDVTRGKRLNKKSTL